MQIETAAPVDASANTTEELWNSFGERLLSFVRKHVRNDADVDDILQDVFVKVHRNVARLRENEKLVSWLFQITRNTITDHYRRRSNMPDGIGDDMPEAVSESSGPDEEREAYSWLRSMVDELPERHRQAIRLTEYEGISQREMSRRLGISFSGAKSRVQRARAKLKDKLLDCCHFELDRRGGVIDYWSKARACGCGAQPIAYPSDSTVWSSTPGITHGGRGVVSNSTPGSSG